MYLANELHVTVFDTVVNHLDVVTGALCRVLACQASNEQRTVSDPLTARLAVTLCGDGLQHILDEWPGLFSSTGHDGGTIASTLFTSRDTSADESEALFCQIFATAIGVGEMRVATVNDNITWLSTSLCSVSALLALLP
jgi:hypothetical protein